MSDIAFNNEIQVKPAANRIGSVLLGRSFEEMKDIQIGQGTILE